MTTPEPDDAGSDHDSGNAEVPPTAPAYSTPPPEGLPDAENQ